MKRTIFICLFMIVSSAAHLGWADPPSGIIVLNLQQYGWRPPEPDKRKGLTLRLNRPSLLIDHKGRTIVGFTVSERKGLVTRNQPSLDLHILRVAVDGKPDLSLSLPTNRGGRTAVYLSDTDQIVVMANNTLQILEATQGDAKHASWRTLATSEGTIALTQSHSRRTM